MYTYRFDYHFHPNFSGKGNYFSQKRAKSIWKKFHEKKLSGVLVCEHAYKNPRSSFEYLSAAAPKNTTTYLIPGIETLSREGIDTIVYAQHSHEIYSHSSLLTPWKLSFEEIINYVEKYPNLYCIITHPYILGNTGLVKHKGESYMQKMVQKVRCVEGHNASFDELETLLTDMSLKRFFTQKTMQRMHNTKHIPPSLRTRGLKITGGSDAHHPWEIGSCMIAQTTKRHQTYDEVFSLFSKQTLMSFYDDYNKFSLLFLARSACTVLREILLKNFYLYSVDSPISPKI